MPQIHSLNSPPEQPFLCGYTYVRNKNGRISARISLFLPECLYIYIILYKRAFLARQHPELPFQYGRGKQRRKFCRSAICGVQFCPGNRRQNSPCRTVLCAHFFAVSGQNLRGRMQFFAAFPEQLGTAERFLRRGNTHVFQQIFLRYARPRRTQLCPPHIIRDKESARNSLAEQSHIPPRKFAAKRQQTIGQGTKRPLLQNARRLRAGERGRAAHCNIEKS